LFAEENVSVDDYHFCMVLFDLWICEAYVSIFMADGDLSLSIKTSNKRVFSLVKPNFKVEAFFFFLFEYFFAKNLDIVVIKSYKVFLLQRSVIICPNFNESSIF